MVSVQYDEQSELKTYLVHQDIQLSDGMARPPAGRFHGYNYKPIFWPDDFVEEHSNYSLTTNSLSVAKLKSYGQKVSKIRKRMRAEAVKLSLKPGVDLSEMTAGYFNRLSKRIHKGYFVEKKPLLEIQEDTPVMNRMRGIRRPVLSVGEKLAIIH